MIPVLNSEQIRALDRYTLEQKSMQSTDLMEQASAIFVKQLLKDFDFEKAVVVCGTGNNGGDGLCIARMLAQKGKTIRVYIADFSENHSPDFKINFERLKKTEISSLHLSKNKIDIEADILIEALFGSGLNRQIEGKYTTVIEQINAFEGSVISVDMPGGMPDAPNFELHSKNCVMADMIYTFHTPKLSLLLPYSEKHCRTFHILDIGLETMDMENNAWYMEANDFSNKPLKAPRFSYKHRKGRLALFGGSEGKSGAIVLSALAAMDSGVGLLTCFIPDIVLTGLQIIVPEAMYIRSGKKTMEGTEIDFSAFDALGIGPGLGLGKSTLATLKYILNGRIPMIIDADAITLIANYKLQNQIPRDSTLTPHPGEFKRLVGNWTSEKEKLQKLMSFCQDHSCVIVLKGANTICCDGRHLYFNSSGNSALATAGTGDVLLGVISTFRAQGYTSLDAARMGVYFHGHAADIFVNENNTLTLRASELAKYMGKALSFPAETKKGLMC